MKAPRKFAIAKLSIRKLGPPSVLIILVVIISTDEDPSLRIESFAVINLRGVSTKLNKYIVITMQTYKKVNKKTTCSAFTFQKFRQQSKRLKQIPMRIKTFHVT